MFVAIKDKNTIKAIIQFNTSLKTSSRNLSKI